MRYYIKMKNKNDTEMTEIAELAEYRDANAEMDSFFRRIVFDFAVFAAALITILGTIISIFCSSAVSSKQVKNDAKILPVFCSIGSVPTPEPTPKPITVLLDAGHGGFDPGTSGTISKVNESDINLVIVNDIAALLKAEGYNVLFTRTDKEALGPGKEDDMTVRDGIIQSSDADIFVSIHQNAYEEARVCGPEVYYHPSKQMAKSLAECVEQRLSQVEGIAPSRGVKEYGHRLTKFLDYSILVECGYLTNPDEESKLISDEYQKRLAEAIVGGINDFCKTHKFN